MLRCEIHRTPAEIPDKTIKFSIDTLGYLAGPPLTMLETHITGARQQVECVWEESDDGKPLKSTCELLSQSRGDKYWWKSKVGLTPSDRAKFGDHFAFRRGQILDAVKKVRRNSALHQY